MPKHRNIPYTEGIFSITLTCARWLPIIEKINGYDIVYKCFDYLKSQGHFICGYVIMPNHIHMLIGFKNTDTLINTILGNSKRFMAYEIVSRLEEAKEEKLLAYLSSIVEPDRKIKNKLHEIWQPSFDWKYCDNEKIIEEKLNYYHNNPCVGKWNLAASPIDYVHSSAYYYITQQQNGYEVNSYFEVLGIDLSKR